MRKQLWTLFLATSVYLVAGQNSADAQSGSYYTGQSNPYKRTAGFGFSNPYHSKINYPTFGTPTALGGGFYNVPSGSANIPMWKAPSGYLYPWAPRPQDFKYAYPLPILMVPQTTPTAAPAVPPISVIIQDLEKFLETSESSARLSHSDVANIKQRIADMKSKEHKLRIAGGGMINPADEAQMRRSLSQIGTELSSRLKS